MSYTIDIIDTIDDAVTLTIEQAIRSSVVLNWAGSDAKDDLSIIGSSLRFTMIDPTFTDGYFDRFFTGNETRFKVRLYRDADGVTIWTGFLLPDSYSEPWKNNLVVVNFEAVDGLGRLKGKYLDDSFYTDEKSVIEIITNCLAKTGLSMPLYFTPAIENYIEKNYHNIYIDGLNFVKKDKKTDAYKILQTLLNDMVCCVYQADDRWYFEGLNTRHIRVINYKHYDVNASYIETVEFTRLLKQATALVTPIVTMVAPYGEITVTHERDIASLPATIATEANDGWAVPIGTVGTIYASDWAGNNNYYAKATAPDYKIALVPIHGESLEDMNPLNFINLKRKIYVGVGQKISFSLKFSNDRSPLAFNNSLRGEIVLNNSIIHEFFIEFDQDDNVRNVSLAFDIVAQEAGLMDLRLYEPFCDGVAAIYPNAQTPRITNFFIDEIKLEYIDFIDEISVSDIINDEYTIKKEIDLTFADDSAGYSKSFLLEKLRNADTSFSTISVPILYGFTQNSTYYSVVGLEGANLIADNLNTVYHSAVLLNNLEVIYNYNQGEQMVVKTETAITSGNFDIDIYNINDVTGSRAYWETWTDAIYQIEQGRYVDTVVNVYRRMFKVPHYKIDMTLNHSVKFNDMLTFPYKGVQNYFLSNCSWVVDEGETNITAIKGYYQNDDIINPGDNIPPIVIAGDDQCIEEGITSVNIDATAYDPDGWIVSVLWEKISGDNDAVIVNPFDLETEITNLNGDTYIFRITVTDNEGATASDTFTVCRIKTYNFTTPISCTTEYTVTVQYGGYIVRRRIFTIAPTTALDPGMSINLALRFVHFFIAPGSITDGGDYLGLTCAALGGLIAGQSIIEKNGSIIYTGPTPYQNVAFVNINMIDGDVIKVQIADRVFTGSTTNTKCDILSATDINGNSTITGLPTTIYVFDNYNMPLNKPVILSTATTTANQVDLVIQDTNTAVNETTTQIEYSIAAADSWTIHGQMAQDATTYNVTGLDADTIYDFRVKAIITVDVIESDYSLIKTETTLP